MTYGQERLRDSPLTKVLEQVLNENSRIVNGAAERGSENERLCNSSQSVTEGNTTTGG